MLNRSPTALSEMIVGHIEGDLYSMKGPEELDFYLKRWRMDVQRMIVNATIGLTYKAFFDGGATPNPGDMKIGGYIEDPFGKRRIYTYSFEIGYGTNNEAEYYSLLHLCHIIVALEIYQVRITGDSKLVINQVNGIWKAKDQRMISLRDEVKDTLKNVTQWDLVHVLRKHNKQADALT